MRRVFVLGMALGLAMATLASCSRGRDVSGLPVGDLDTIFSHGALNEYWLTMSPSDLYWLNHHELLEEYVPGNLSFVNFNRPSALYERGTLTGAVGAELYKNVGIRYKGSKGSLEFCFSNATGNAGSNAYNKRLCKKLSLKISFDKYDDEGRFYDMKKINLHGMMNDPSMMRECLAYGLYRRMGVPVPRCAHAKVFVNGEYQGLYAAVEYVDSRFLEFHFGEKEGVLFKEKWPGISEEANEAEYFLAGVRNRKSKTTKKDVKPILKFSQKIWDAQDLEEVGKLFQKHWNTDTILNTLVVASVIDDWDSFFTFFPKDPNREVGWARKPPKRFNHNFYIYQDMGEMLNLIQWDTDLTFSEYGSVLELFFGCPPWNVPLCEIGTRHCTPCIEYKPYNVSQGSPVDGMLPGACDKMLSYIGTEMKQDYLERMWYFLQEVFIVDEIEKVVKDWQALLKDAHACDPNYPAGKGIFPDPGQNKTIPVLWEVEVESVLGTIRQEYKRALERSNPVYRPHVPDRKKIRKVFKCVKDCAAFMDLHDVKSLYTCYSICLFEVDPDSEDQHPY